MTVARSQAPTPTLAELRAEIDAVDDELLRLLEQRLDAARRVGQVKAQASALVLNLKPDREAAVLGRLLARARPETRAIAQAIWREVMAFGLAIQGEIEVVVWSASQDAALAWDARNRFGAAPAYTTATTAEAALAAARSRDAVAVLALEPELQPGADWWRDLADAWPDLWLFEAIGGVAAPRALALGRIDPAALAQGTRWAVTTDEPRDGRTVAHVGGRRLVMLPASTTPLDARERTVGVVGMVPGEAER